MAKLPSFRQIEARAAQRKGGPEGLAALLPSAKSDAALRRTKDAAWLAEMTRRVFCAGFVWRVVEDKWPDFEAVFSGFDPRIVATLADEELDQIASDARIVRNRSKVWSARDNARFVLDTAAQHRSFGRWVAGWPVTDTVDLLDQLKRGGTRLGGASGQYLLRRMGKDCFVLSNDVVRALIRAKVVERPPTSKGALRKVQEAFNTWSEESGRPLCQLSRILACSEP